MLPKTFQLLVLAVLAGASHADAVIGTIHTLHVNLPNNQAFVQLDGLPYFNGGGCSSYWTINTADDNFMKKIWPLLLTAKASATPVKIFTSGCIGAWPTIISVDLDPRLAD